VLNDNYNTDPINAGYRSSLHRKNSPECRRINERNTNTKTTNIFYWITTGVYWA